MGMFYKGIIDIYDKQTGRRIETLVIRNEDEFYRKISRLHEESKKGKITFGYDAK